MMNELDFLSDGELPQFLTANSTNDCVVKNRSFFRVFEVIYYYLLYF